MIEDKNPTCTFSILSDLVSDQRRMKLSDKNKAIEP